MIRIVRLGSTRAENEGVRVGTVRRPPRGVPKSDYSKKDIYDVWLPTLAPSEALVKQALGIASADDRSWKQFVRRYRTEMKEPAARHLLDTLAALSHESNFSVGCYCEDERRCHRSVLRELLIEHGATVVADNRSAS